MWQAKQFLANRPKTSLFLGTTLFLGSLPITIFASIVLCVSLALGAAFILLQGTVLVVTLAGLTTTLAGPICVAAIVTLVFYAGRRFLLALRRLRLGMLTSSRQILEKFQLHPGYEANTRNKDGHIPPGEGPGDKTPKVKHYKCEFCRAHRHDLCVSRKRPQTKSIRNAGQQTAQSETGEDT